MIFIFGFSCLVAGFELGFILGSILEESKNKRGN